MLFSLASYFSGRSTGIPHYRSRLEPNCSPDLSREAKRYSSLNEKFHHHPHACGMNRVCLDLRSFWTESSSFCQKPNQSEARLVTTTITVQNRDHESNQGDVDGSWKARYSFLYMDECVVYKCMWEMFETFIEYSLCSMSCKIWWVMSYVCRGGGISGKIWIFQAWHGLIWLGSRYDSFSVCWFGLEFQE